MKLLLTGGTGFVGGALLPHLKERGHDVVQVTRVPREGALTWNLGTLERPELPAGIDAVVHLAQSRLYRNFPGDAEAMFTVNVASTHALLQAAALSGIPRFCLVSSGAVYEPFTGPLSEDAVLAPTGFLGASKLAGEVIARPYGKLMSLAVLRLFFPYGRGQHGRLIPEIVRRVSGGIPVDVSDDGEGLRVALTHVDDVCAAIIESFEQGWSGTFNVAAPEVVSVATIGRIIGSAIGREPSFNLCMPELRPIVPDLSRFASVFDLRRMKGFSSGVRDVVESP